jgi:adenosylcobinamide-GDP ribazoletransferase
MPDSLRLALGTLTAIRVPAPRVVDRRVAGRAMLLAPVVGAVLGSLAAVVLGLVRLASSETRLSTTFDLLGAVLAITTLAWLTRGLHLDGLADTVDGLGVKGQDDGVRERRLTVMRQPDVGAFGVVALVLVIALQTVALTACALEGFGTVGLVVAAVVGRLAATWACTPAYTSARPDGLGATVAGSVGRNAAVAMTLAVLAGAVLLGGLDDDGSRAAQAVLVVGALAGLLGGTMLLRRCAARFGGITGDVLGATVEVTTAVVLVVVALGLGLAR